MSILFVSMGLSESEIGILFGLQTLGDFIATPLWSCLADRLQNRYLVYQITLIGSGITVLLLAVPYYDFERPIGVFLTMTVACSIFYLFARAATPITDSLILLRLDNKRKHSVPKLGPMLHQIPFVYKFICKNTEMASAVQMDSYTMSWRACYNNDMRCVG